MEIQTIFLIAFSIIVSVFLILDLGFFNRKAHKVSTKSALLQSLFWIGIALAFSGALFYFMNAEVATQFLSAYVTEKMLSVDNLFVILLIFNYFNLEEKYHHRVLFWGILGAIVFRGIFILAGAYIISQFHWVLYIFGAILIYTGIRLFSDNQEEHADFENNVALRLVKRIFPFTNSPHHGKFFLRENGKLYGTILLLIVFLVETTDVVFAMDSIPAAFSISQDPFVVFTSNVFAILGLRALFFLLESVMHRFHHLQKGLSFILVFVGAKMLADIFHIHISSILSFGIIMAALGFSLLLSLLYPKKI